ncbi:hypothetical protein ACWEKR_09050 [Nocardia sp. NPDC004573]
MGKAGEWRPGDIANAISAASKITGSLPDLIRAIGTLDDDIDDVIKAGGEAIKSGGEGIAKVIDTVDNNAEPGTGTPSPTEVPSTGTPSPTEVPGTPTLADPTTANQSAHTSLMGLPPVGRPTDDKEHRPESRLTPTPTDPRESVQNEAQQ